MIEVANLTERTSNEERVGVDQQYLLGLRMVKNFSNAVRNNQTVGIFAHSLEPHAHKMPTVYFSLARYLPLVREPHLETKSNHGTDNKKPRHF